MKKLVSALPIVGLVCISLLVFLTNFSPGTYLLGWDNTAPELNPVLNWSRFFSSTWQEYRGLGTQDGMAHSANLPYLLFTQLLSLVLPVSLIRYASNLLLHLLGGIGMFWLLTKAIFPKLTLPHQPRLATPLVLMSALIAALVYQFNLMTIQMFYTPLELFSVHFALLPWGFYTLIQFLDHPNRRHFWWLLLVQVLGSAQAHVPTIFIPYALSYGLVLLSYLLSHPKEYLKTVLIAGIALVAANAYWALPYAYSIPTKSAEISNSKQNRLGTDGIFFRNLAWGDLKSLATFGGFQLEYRDWFESEQKFDRIMREWYELYQTPLFQTTGWLITFSGVAGAFWLGGRRYKHHNPLVLGWLLVFGFALLMLGTNTPVLRDITAVLRKVLPLFYQIFRFTFTKFSLLYVFSLSSLFGVFWFLVLQTLQTRVLLQKGVFAGFVATMLGSLIVMTQPIWRGYFYYPALKITIPESVTATVNTLNQQPELHRLLTLPIHSLWGWTTSANTWGYRGSGFLWQLIAQPMLDRSFDPWSRFNETAYLQISQALYRQDYATANALLQKFHTDQVLFDWSVFHPGGYAENLNKPALQEWLGTANFTLLFQAGDQHVYQTQTVNPLVPFAPNQATLVDQTYQYTYTTRDQAYLDTQSYLVTPEQGRTYPFSGLQSDELFADQVLFQDQVSLTADLGGQSLVPPPPLSRLESVISGLFTTTPSGQNTTIGFVLNLPTIITDTQTLPNLEQPITVSPSQNNLVVLEDQTLFELDPTALGQTPALLSLPTQGIIRGTVYAQTTKANLQLGSRTECGTASFCTTSQFVTTAQDQLVATSALIPQQVQMPDICLSTLADPTTCLNTQLSFETTQQPGVVKIKTAISAQPTTTYLVQFTWPATSPKTFWQLPTLQTYQKLDTFVFDVNHQLNQFDRQLATALATQPTKLTFDFNTKLFTINALRSNKPRSSGPQNCQFNRPGTVQKTQLGQVTEYVVTKQASGCETYYLSELDHRQEYLFHAQGKTLSGAGVQFTLINPASKHQDLQTASRTGSFNLVAPLYPSTGTNTTDNLFQLALGLETFGQELNRVQIQQLRFLPLPLSWLTTLHTQTEAELQSYDTTIQAVSKWGTTLYLVSQTTQTATGLLVLPQSFDAGYVALDIHRWQFLPHHLYNGWANAYTLKMGSSSILILFWPQLLMWLGVGLLGAVMLYGWKSRVISVPHPKSSSSTTFES